MERDDGTDIFEVDSSAMRIELAVLTEKGTQNGAEIDFGDEDDEKMG